MDSLQFWKQKLIQFFHDPPAKPFALYPGTGGHVKIAKELFNRFTREQLLYYNPRPDWAASGADRPMLNQPRGASPIQLGWPSTPILTHPLWPAQLRVELEGVANLAQKESRDDRFEEQAEALDRITDPLSDWQNAKTLQRDFTRLWRRFRDEIAAHEEHASRLLWEEMPSDGRVPDHSIWDHLRVTTALAFLPEGKRRCEDPEDPRAPWLLRFTLHPVQRLIAEARTSRDLWLGSFLLADLTWHAIQPIVTRYGHDAVLYPDLRGNPLVDNWLADGSDAEDILPQDVSDASSFASLLPAAFTAVVPRGEKGTYLIPLQELAEACGGKVQKRWHELEKLVADWLEEKTTSSEWRTIWERQHRKVIGTSWSAVAWLPPETVKQAENLPGRALPAQHSGFRSNRDQRDLEAIAKRSERLQPWLPAETWIHYENARQVYAKTHLRYHQMERGFDYALTHHQLAVRHALRRAQSPTESHESAEPGEKCTCCGRRQALTNGTGGTIGQDRKQAVAFWARPELNPDASGHERLCGVCTMKRFLIEACDLTKGLNPVWAGRGAEADKVLDRDGKIRVPFPSTATVAAQAFIAEVVGNPTLQPALRDLIDAHQALRLPYTSFPRSLPRLAAAAARLPEEAIGRRFLELEAEEVLFPDAIRGMGRDPKIDDPAGYNNLATKAANLRIRAKERGIAAPKNRIAVLVMDGDRISRLLLGDKEVIRTTWRDVIHPKALDQVENNPRLQDAGWPDLLEARRLTGPALHAYITRALALFGHHIVPWVVEREFSGRLIYAGGDDLLCLVPGDEALDLAARLQQLFSSPWVIDTRPGEPAWAWRKRDWKGEYDQDRARRRYALPRFVPDSPVHLPITDPAALHGHVAGSGAHEPLLPELPVQGRVMPMLGPGHSLSAGIAFGHYKTPLQVLLQRAREMLKQEAKGSAGRAALAISHATRGGEKNSFAMRWRGTDVGPGAHSAMARTIRGFAEGGLPGRLPYKLRELAPNVKVIRCRMEKPEPWLRGLFLQALGDSTAKVFEEAAFTLWNQGLSLYPKDPDKAVGGLLICRALAGAGEERE